MKRFWLVLLSLGLIVAFSTSAMAVDVKFSGEYYAAGMYLDKTTLNKSDVAGQNKNLSTAFYYQRMRLNTTFIVHPGLFLITRADIMERAWGAARTAPGVASDLLSAGTAAENENIAFDLAYLQYISPIGIIRVGYQDDGAWGTVFADSTSPVAKAQWIGVFGPVQAIAYLGKFKENNTTFKNPAPTAADTDIDLYCAAINYVGKQVQAGLLFKHYRSANLKQTGVPPFVQPFMQAMTVGVPYVKAKFGPVALQAEVLYGWGDYFKGEQAGLIPDSRLDNWAGWIDATADFGMFYAGGSVAYVAGDDPGTADKKEGGFITGGADWNPCLILFNFDRYKWAGSMLGYNATRNPNANDNPFLATSDAGMTNAWFFSLRAGVRPVEKLDIMVTGAYANADKKPAGVINNAYGYEVDVTATYKITNNLSYMIGGGYLFTGDYFKGANTNPTGTELQNNYLLINKLTLTF